MTFYHLIYKRRRAHTVFPLWELHGKRNATGSSNRRESIVSERDIKSPEVVGQVTGGAHRGAH